MVALETLAMLGLAILASLFTAWTIGAGSSGSTPFAPAVGANVMPIMRAAFLVGILGFLGAVLQGAAVTETMGRELINGVTLTPLAATISLTVAAGLILVGVFTGYPIATAFAVAGAIVGVGIALGGDPAWHKYQEIGLLWALTPPVGVGASYATARLLRSDDVPEKVLVPALGGVVGLIVANMEFTLLGAPGEAGTIAETVAALLPGPSVPLQAAATLGVALAVALPMARSSARDVNRTMRRFLLIMGSLVAFSAGGGKVGLAIGPLLPLLDALAFEVSITWVLLLGGFGLLLGSWMAATRMIKALAQDYSELGPRRSIAVLIPSFAIAQAAIFYGLPISFNEIFVSAIVGSGYAAGGSSVSQSKMAYTVLAWVGSLVLAFVVSYGLLVGISAVL